MRTALAALGVYLGLTLAGWVKVRAERPRTCPRGHADHYCVNRWRCRECASKAMARGLRKLARERSKSCI